MKGFDTDASECAEHGAQNVGKQVREVAIISAAPDTKRKGARW